MKIIIGIIFIILSASALAQEAILPDSTGLAGAAGADKVEWLNRLAEASIKTAPERSIEYSQWALELADSTDDAGAGGGFEESGDGVSFPG